MFFCSVSVFYCILHAGASRPFTNMENGGQAPNACPGYAGVRSTLCEK